MTSNSNIGAESDYKPKVLRVALGTFSFIFVLAAYQTLFGTGNITANMTVVFIITYILLPAIFVHNHPHLRDHAKQKLRNSLQLH